MLAQQNRRWPECKKGGARWNGEAVSCIPIDPDNSPITMN